MFPCTNYWIHWYYFWKWEVWPCGLLSLFIAELKIMIMTRILPVCFNKLLNILLSNNNSKSYQHMDEFYQNNLYFMPSYPTTILFKTLYSIVFIIRTYFIFSIYLSQRYNWPINVTIESHLEPSLNRTITQIFVFWLAHSMLKIELIWNWK